jgi:hypothetical protein
MAKKDKNAEIVEQVEGAEAAVAALPTGDGIRLSAHPRARRHISIAKGWGGLIAFLLVLKISRGAALPWPDAIERAVVGGVVGYLTLWIIAQNIWRHVALAELEDLRKRLIAKAEEQATARAAMIAEAEATRAAAADRAAAAAQPVP